MTTLALKVSNVEHLGPSSAPVNVETENDDEARAIMGTEPRAMNR